MRLEEEAFSYKPLVTDAIDVKLSHYINFQPLTLRSKMNFQRESEGVYKYQRKRVIIKIEGESIVIRVGGGYLTIEQFVHEHCSGSEDITKARMTSIAH